MLLYASNLRIKETGNIEMKIKRVHLKTDYVHLFLDTNILTKHPAELKNW
jgi:hypothetical protein